jgi:osmotically-inducible protein OsmY
MQTVNSVRAAATLLTVLCAAIVVGPKTARSQGDPQATDKAIETVVKNKLTKDGLLQNDNIQILVANHTITLSGTVPSLADKARAGRDVHKVEERYKVVNNLTVQTPNLSNKELAAAVVDRIQKHVFYSVFDWITIDADNGVITLQGWVYEPWHKTQFVNQAKKVAGVREVKDDIRDEFGSSSMRVNAAQLIYNDPMFEEYAASPNPPIHIIVATGDQIILEGVVASAYQRDYAASLLQDQLDAFVTNNLVVRTR